MFPSKALAILELSAQDYLLLALPVSELVTAMILTTRLGELKRRRSRWAELQGHWEQKTRSMNIIRILTAYTTPFQTTRWLFNRIVYSKKSGQQEYKTTLTKSTMETLAIRLASVWVTVWVISSIQGIVIAILVTFCVASRSIQSTYEQASSNRRLLNRN